MFKLIEQFMTLTGFLTGKTAPISKRAGSYIDGSMENITSPVKTKSLIKKVSVMKYRTIILLSFTKNKP